MSWLPTERRPHLDGLAIGVLLLCCAIWGGQQSLIKLTLNEVPPLLQATFRFVGATVLLMVWCRLRGIKLFQADGSLLGGTVAGLLFAGEFVFVYNGMALSTASRITVFLYTAPFWVAVLLPRFVPAEHLSRKQWAGLTLAFASVALAFSEGLTRATGYHELLWLGDAMGLIAGMMWGLTTLTIRLTKLGQASAEKVLFYQVAAAAVVLPLLSSVRGEAWAFDYPLWAWGSMAFQALVGAFATFLAWMWLLRFYPATHMSTFVFFSPVFAMAFGVGLLGEPLTWQMVVGLTGVGVGIALVSQKRKA